MARKVANRLIRLQFERHRLYRAFTAALKKTQELLASMTEAELREFARRHQQASGNQQTYRQALQHVRWLRRVARMQLKQRRPTPRGRR